MTNRSPTTDPRTRAADLFAHYADIVAIRLLRRYRGIDPDTVTDAVVEAILELSADAITSEQPIDALADRARQRLRIRLRGDCRRRTRERIYSESVTIRRLVAPSPVDALCDQDARAATYDQIAQTPVERNVLELWLNGTTDPDALATQTGQTRSEIVTILARFRQRIKRERDRQMSSPDHPEGTI